MKRRDAILASLAALCTGAASRAVAQATERLRRVGFITLRSGLNEYDAAFREALRGLGYVEGQTIRIDYRWAAGSEQRADQLAAEMLAAKPEVIVAATTPAIRAAMRATKEVPIVIAAAADPVGSGLVASLARPGGNVTGLSLVSPDTAAKRLQLLQELIPAVSRIAVLIMDTGVAGESNALIDQLQAAARQLRLEIAIKALRSGADIPGAFATIQQERAQALIVSATPISIDHRGRIAEMAASQRLPAMYESQGFVEAGGLLSYGPSLIDMYRRAAVYVDKILKGAKPADLPIELPVKYELALNLKAARALGLKVPQSIVVRADRVIDEK
jgi:putative ABC transport system substrate-binding protein